MRVAEYVAQLTAEGVLLHEEDGRLRYRARQGVLTPRRLAWLRENKPAVLEHLRVLETGPGLVPDPGARHDPFPLTDVQSAYLLGRGEAFDYGGVACHGYLEIALPAVADDTVEDAWNTLIQRHDMLRAVVSAEGHQRVLPQVPRYHVAHTDLGACDGPEERHALEAVRARMSHRHGPAERWPLFDLRTTRTARGLRLHLSVDLLICDYSSIRLLLAELHELCTGAPPADPPGVTFRDYVLAARATQEGTRYQRDRAYWWDRVDSLPPAPELPLRTDAPAAPPRFHRHGTRLGPRRWEALNRRAAAAGVTASGALLQAFAEAVGRWSRHPRFTLGLTVQNRLPVHPGVDRVVGDFSSTSLLAVDLGDGTSLAERAQASQARLWDDMDHRLCGGVEVLREIARRRGRAEALMPVVFTSTVGGPGGGTGAAGPSSLMPGGTLVHGITQTPQVWIDCQIMEDDGGLLAHWDVREGLFPDGVVQDMFDAFARLTHRLAGEDAVWHEADPLELPAAQVERLARVNATEAPRTRGPLHAQVVAQAVRTPGRTAVVAPGRRLDYAELLARARGVAAALTREGVAPGERVGIVMDKGWEQVVAVLGVLLAGGAYLPVDTTQPALRRAAVLADAAVRTVLTQSWLSPGLELPPGVRSLTVDTSAPAGGEEAYEDAATGPDDLAYVLYTSGSTGTPKGVMITHAAARNTVDDINHRFAVGPDDRILGLAHLGFDLSVYDIFGPLSVGGALVLPDAGRRGDPAHWAALAEEHAVTLWNSVPAQLQMLQEYLRTGPARGTGRMRLALLSGDWIPVTLPDAIRAHVPSLRVIALGGATEAAIWSIHHPVTDVDPDLVSIPYGRPLANQTVHVLDHRLRDCPEHVTGELYIGGAGLALGYLGDAERTRERFVVRPHSGERLYRTGDLGRRGADGVIELLGREDGQVKLNGHRVELAEVEAALRSHPSVRLAAALARGEGAARGLVAFAETARVRRRPAPGPELARQAEEAAGRAAGFDEAEHADAVRALCAALDASALQAMSLLLRERGLFASPGDLHTAGEAAAACGAHARHQGLVRRWLGALEAAGRLTRDRDGGYRGLAPVRKGDRAELWARVDALERAVGWGPGLVRFHRDCEARLAALLSGELPLRDLLFPEGRLDTAAAAYRGNLISRYNNAAVTGAVRHLVREHQGLGPVRLLEIGAGVGGTSAGLIPALEGLPVDYHFTDVSHFFLAEAREAFAAHPWVRFGLFDLDKDYRAQGFRPNGADVVVAANVLHNAVHAGRALERIRELTAPGGWLVFVEATRDTARAMTSMEFNDGLTGFTDAREKTGAPFLTRPQWLDLLREAGAETALCLPREDSALADVGQQVFAARFKPDRAALTTAELRAHLTERLPGHMIPAELQVVDTVPLTANGKVDRARLARLVSPAAAGAAAGEAGAAPADDLERTLAGLWSQVLDVPAVGRHADFFALGGDSLLVARLVGRMREHLPQAAGMDWDDLLRCVLNRPTVAALADRLRPAGGTAGGPPATTASPLVRIGGGPGTSAGPGGSGEPTTLLLVHDGTGTVGPYRALVQELSGRLPVAGLVVDDLDAYLGGDPGTLIAALADRYAGVLLDQGLTRVHLVGYCMGGLLATELAGRLGGAGAEVSGVSVISSYRVPYLVEDDLLAEYVFARMMRADTVALGYPRDEAATRALVTAATRRHGDRVPRGSLTERPATALGPAGTGALRAFRSLAARPQEERLRAIGAYLPQESAELRAPERLERAFRTVKHSLAAVAAHRATPYTGATTLVRQRGEAEIFPGMHHDMRAYWQRVCGGGLRVTDVPGDHFTCVRPPHAAALAGHLLRATAGGAA
ncbi:MULTISPECIES: non-ribosomal peptide synthetase [unclassified Streptomyces]|uniref:non-ribosomal peptide synthetase n=1 Tax=unclassified Streptomyces TaxID=2593676 RepID=UPI000804F917|nr:MULTISPECIES: non-ribosomal peptide synthetase [unclassified Streptomyces]MYR72828.1 amino acid adenylation domain-containing protein [Streptomyces sp. SID4925]SBU95448.1 pyochelin synthetase [Streptomyces sp. OspMP-M45]